MKLIVGDNPKTNKRPFISTDKFSVKAEVDNCNIIEGFTVETKDRKQPYYIPVIRQQYWKAWEKVYNLIKKYL